MLSFEVYKLCGQTKGIFLKGSSSRLNMQDAFIIIAACNVDFEFRDSVTKEDLTQKILVDYFSRNKHEIIDKQIGFRIISAGGYFKYIRFLEKMIELKRSESCLN